MFYNSSKELISQLLTNDLMITDHHKRGGGEIGRRTTLRW